MSREAAAAGLMTFLEETWEAPSVLWLAGMAMIERACSEGREAADSRFRHHPQGQLRAVVQRGPGWELRKSFSALGLAEPLPAAATVPP